MEQFLKLAAAFEAEREALRRRPRSSEQDYLDYVRDNAALHRSYAAQVRTTTEQLRLLANVIELSDLGEREDIAADIRIACDRADESMLEAAE